MQIYINGQPRQIEDAATVSALVEFLELTGRRVAVEVNEELVPRSRFQMHRLAAGDRVEIIHAVGGG
jgi:sulfur carrier protein